MKKYKTRLTYSMAEALEGTISQILLEVEPETDDDKLLHAALAEVVEKLQLKMVRHFIDCSISFTPAQAISLRLLATSFFGSDLRTQLGNKLSQIAFEVHQRFA